MDRQHIFLSHADADKQVANRLFDLMQMCGVIEGRIFCTSAEGYGIDTGTKFIDEIKSRMQKSALVVLLLSPNYYASTFCIAEMGAAWALELRVFPLMLNGVPRDPGVVFSRVQSQEFSSIGLDSLHEVMLESCLIEKANTARWSIKKQELLDDLPRLLESLPSPGFVRREEYDRKLRELRAARAMIKVEKKKCERIAKNYEALKHLKNAEEVRAVEVASLGSRKAYSELVKDAKKAVEKLDSVTQRCLFAWLVNSPWRPDPFTEYNSQIQEAIERGRVLTDDDEAWVLIANESHPALRKPIRSVRILADFLDEPDNNELLEELEEELGCPVSVTNRDFFEAEITGSRLPT